MINGYKAVIIIILFSSQVLHGGTSIFGIKDGYLGECQYNYSASALGRGGFSMGNTDSLSINQENYAQWPYLSRSMIAINGGYNGQYSEINNASTYSSDFNFKGGFIIIPLSRKKLVMGIGLTPILSNNLNVQINEGSSVTHNVEIEGNITEAKFVLSYLLSQKLSIAAFTNYTFGIITDYNLRRYNQGNSEDIQFTNKYRIHGISFGFSTLYRLNERFASGMQIRLPARLFMETTKTARDFIKEYEDRKVSLPLSLSIGGLYYLKEQWLVGMDLNLQNWKTGYTIDDNDVENMNNSIRLGAGTEYLPPKKRFIPLWQRITYRGGFFWGKFNTMANNNEVYEYGATVGLGLPVGYTPNHLDISFELGKRGDLPTNSGEESFFRLQFTFTAAELWFVKFEK